MADENKNVVITKAARKKMVKARAGKLEAESLKIAKMRFGTGGCDGEGNPQPPEDDAGDVKAKIEGADTDITEENRVISEDGLRCTYTVTLGEDSAADGKFISEIALVDSDGEVVAIKTFAPKGKDADTEMTFSIDDIF